MKRVKIESYKDILALPEDEWVHVPDGWKVIWEDVPARKPRRRARGARKASTAKPR